MASRGAETAPRILGLTGPIGCGKTTVGDILLELGAIARIDADVVVHGLMRCGTETTERVRQAFGDAVITTDGSVDRARLAEVVFGKDARLRLLESIVHPAVREEIRRRLAGFRGRNGVVVVDAVRLLQSDLLPLMDEVWVILCSPASQMERLTARRGMEETAARARIAAQPPFDHPAVTRVIQNSGSLPSLRRSLRDAWEDFSRLHQSPR